MWMYLNVCEHDCCIKNYTVLILSFSTNIFKVETTKSLLTDYIFLTGRQTRGLVQKWTLINTNGF